MKLKNYMVSGKLEYKADMKVVLKGELPPAGKITLICGARQTGKSIVQSLAQDLGRYPTSEEIQEEVRRLNDESYRKNKSLITAMKK